MFIALGVVHFSLDKFENLPEKKLSAQDFDAINLVQTGDNSFVSTSNDPQLIYSSAQPIRSITYTLKKGGNGAVAVYYIDDNGDFSAKKCVLPSFKRGNYLEFILPHKDIYKVRIDISGVKDEHIEWEKFTVNTNVVLDNYFNITTMDIAKFLFLPIFAASIIIILKEIFSFYTKKVKIICEKHHKQR